MRRIIPPAATILLGTTLAIVGCSSSGDETKNTDDTATAPSTPMWVSIEPMAGALHLVWMKHTDCDEVDVERKTTTEAYKVVATVPCESDNKHDTGATDDVDYTYRLLAKKGALKSKYSEEKVGHP